MKKVLVILIAVFGYNTVMACDICGCGVGSYYVGILPEFSKKIVGVRYRYSSLQSHIGAGGVRTYLTTDEHFHTTEVWGGWTIGKKIRLIGYIPLGFNQKINEEGLTRKTGLGDMGLQGFYRVFDHRKTTESDKMMIHSLWLGAGVKMPTGKYEEPVKNNNEQSLNVFQLGTGSTDFTINGMYDFRLQDAGLNTMASYKINTANNSNYRYGNKFMLSLQGYHKFRILNKITLAPNAGIVYELADKDIDAGYKVGITGGNILLGTVGAEINFNRIAVGGNFQLPLSQHLAGGFAKAGNRSMFHVAFMF